VSCASQALSRPRPAQTASRPLIGTVTGHVASSLGMENIRTVADAWTEDLNTGVAESFAEIASTHQNGVSVLVAPSRSPSVMDCSRSMSAPAQKPRPAPVRTATR